MGCGRKATPSQIRRGRKVSRKAPPASLRNAGRTFAPQAPRAPPVTTKRLFGLMNAVTNQLGGGEGQQGTFGTLAPAGSQKVMDALAVHTGMGRASKLLDVGAGLGHPLVHAVHDVGVARARGLEVDPVKVKKAEAFIDRVYSRAGMTGPKPYVERADVGSRTAPIDDTHIFSFWKGINTADRAALGSLAAKDTNLKGVAVIDHGMGRDPVGYMRSLGFPPMTLTDKLDALKISGSGATFTGYVFKVR